MTGQVAVLRGDARMPLDLLECGQKAAPAVREHPGAMAHQQPRQVVDSD